MLKIIALVFLVLTAQLHCALAARETHAHLPAGGTGRPLVDARYLRHHHAGRAGAVQRARHHQAGPGAIAFGAVVVLTMFAAMSFDPRLIWDAVEA